MKRDIFRVELRRKHTEELFKTKRKSTLNCQIHRDYLTLITGFNGNFGLLKPQNQLESDIFWSSQLIHDIPKEKLSEYLDCYLEATFYSSSQTYNFLFQRMEQVLKTLYEEACEGTNTVQDMLEDCLLIIYNLNVNAKKQNQRYSLSVETKRVLYQLLIIYTSPEVFKINLKVIQTCAEQLEETQNIVEHCLSSLNDSLDDEIIKICLETINTFLIRCQILSTPLIPIIQGINFLNSSNYQVRYQILLYYVQISSFESNIVNVSRETILTIQKIFLQEQKQDLLILGLVFLANACAALIVVDEITKNLVLLNKMKLLFRTQLFPEAWSLCCILIWSGGDQTTNIFQKLNINQEIMDQFVNLTNTFQINQLLEAMIELKDLKFFNHNNFIHKLQDISINGDVDGCAMSSILLKGF